MQINRETLLKHPAFVLGGVFFLLWLIFSKSFPVICTDDSRLATIDSLVNHRTFEISDSQFIGTCDKVRIPPTGEGKYVSDKPPLLSVIGAGIYYVLRLVKLDFRKDLEIVFRLLVFFLVLLPSFLIFYFLEMYLSAYSVKVETKAWVLAASVFGTLILPYSMVLQNHNIAAALLLGSYVYLENPMKKKKGTALIFSGLLLGLAVSMDLNVLFFALTFFLLSLWIHGRKNLFPSVSFILMAALPILFTLYLFWIISGKWVPFVLQPEGYFYEGSQMPKTNSFGFGSKSIPFSSYLIFLWHSLLGYRGIFSHSAALIFGFWGLAMSLKKSNKTFPYALAITGGVSILWAFLAFQYPLNFGGSSFGFRYMAIWMPLVMLFAFRVFESYGLKPWMKGLIFISVVTSGLGVRSPWLIHKFDPIDLDGFDFLLANDVNVNPYMQYEITFLPYQEEIQSLKARLDPDSLMKLAAIYYRGIRPSEALGYLDLIGEEHSDRECYKGVLFSKRGLNLPDLMKRHVDRCPKEQWLKLSKEMDLEMQSK